MDRDKLHLSDLISHCLVGRHKASWPCGGIFYERTSKRDTAPVCVAYCVRYARIRNTAYIVNVGQLAVLYIVLCHYLAVACTHRFNGHTLIYRIRIAVICPHERAYMHLAFIAVAEHLTAVRGYHIYLAGTKLFICAVAELLERERFERYAVAVTSFSYNDRKSAILIPCGDNSVLCENDKGHRTVDLALSIPYAIGKIVLLCDKRTDERAGIDTAAAHCFKVCTAALEQLGRKLFSVSDNADTAY